MAIGLRPRGLFDSTRGFDQLHRRFADEDPRMEPSSPRERSHVTVFVPGRVTAYLLPCESSARDEVDARALLDPCSA